jgi:C-terminal processing protease CtpA/Prc
LRSRLSATLSNSGRSTNVIGYLRINSFNGYVRNGEFLKQLDAMETALDDIFKDSTQLTGLVIDLRINGGGSDVFGISIASRLATQNYLAYEKVIRNDILDPDHRTPPQPVSRLPTCYGTAIGLKCMPVDNCQSIAW